MTPEELAASWEAEAGTRDGAVSARLLMCAHQLRSASRGRAGATLAGALALGEVLAFAAYCLFLATGGR